MSPGTTSRTCSKVSRRGGRAREGAVAKRACEGRGRGQPLRGSAGEGVADSAGHRHHGAAEPGGTRGARAGRREGREGAEAGGEDRGAAGLVPPRHCRSREPGLPSRPRSHRPGRAGRGIAGVAVGCSRLCLTEGAAAAQLRRAGSLSARRGGRAAALRSCTLSGRRQLCRAGAGSSGQDAASRPFEPFIRASSR